MVVHLPLFQFVALPDFLSRIQEHKTGSGAIDNYINFRSM